MKFIAGEDISEGHCDHCKLAMSFEVYKTHTCADLKEEDDDFFCRAWNDREKLEFCRYCYEKLEENNNVTAAECPATTAPTARECIDILALFSTGLHRPDSLELYWLAKARLAQLLKDDVG